MSFRLLVVAVPALCMSGGVHADATPVTPPLHPRISNEYVDASTLVAFRQPAALAAQLDALAQGNLEERISKLKKKVVDDLIVVKGGAFMMGDFGPLVSTEGLHYSDDLTSRPAHEVALSTYSISRYKTTYAEFDVFADATHTPRAASGKVERSARYPSAPAGVPWQRAKDYCQWLKKATQLPFDLPTEAQWEFAARSRGQFFVFATDNGHIDYGRNVPAADHIPLLTPSKTLTPYPVGLFPPNPLGLYDASHNGEEWVNDWFDEQYYKQSPKKDPQGPANGTLKVARGWPIGDSLAPNTMYRRARPLVFPAIDLKDLGTAPPSYRSQTFRCAVKQTQPAR